MKIGEKTKFPFRVNYIFFSLKIVPFTERLWKYGRRQDTADLNIAPGIFDLCAGDQTKFVWE